nr:antitermination protein [Providencia rettgeri]
MNTIEAAKGHWAKIFSLYDSPPVTGNKHYVGECPICGRKGKFRIDNKDDRGTWICTCGSGNGIQLLERVTGKSFKTLADELDCILGIERDKNATYPIKVDSAESKRVQFVSAYSRMPSLNNTSAAQYLQNRGVFTLPTEQVRFCDMGMTESQAKFGMTAFLAKNDVSEEDKFSTVEALTQYAKKITPKLVAKAAGKKLGYCLIVLTRITFEDYARSAGSVFPCSACSGKGLIYKRKDVIKHPGITRLDGTVIIEPWTKNEEVGELCQECNGKGQLAHRCRCKGRGKVLDDIQTKL